MGILYVLMAVSLMSPATNFAPASMSDSSRAPAWSVITDMGVLLRISADALSSIAPELPTVCPDPSSFRVDSVTPALTTISSATSARLCPGSRMLRRTVIESASLPQSTVRSALSVSASISTRLAPSAPLPVCSVRLPLGSLNELMVTPLLATTIRCVIGSRASEMNVSDSPKSFAAMIRSPTAALFVACSTAYPRLRKLPSGIVSVSSPACPSMNRAGAKDDTSTVMLSFPPRASISRPANGMGSVSGEKVALRLSIRIDPVDGLASRMESAAAVA